MYNANRLGKLAVERGVEKMLHLCYNQLRVTSYEFETTALRFPVKRNTGNRELVTDTKETPLPKLQPITFTLTPQQLKWLKQWSLKTGLHQVEIVRRALDAYADAEELKEQRRLFSPQQRLEIREAARRKGIGEKDVVREAVTRELKFMAKLYAKRKGS